MASETRRRAATRTTVADSPQNAPPELETVVGYLLRRAHYVYTTYWLTHFRATETPITPMQSGALIMVQRHHDVTQSELARLLGIEAPTAFHLVSKLERGGYIERVPDGTDKRAQFLRLTPAGGEILKAISELIQIRDADLMAGFTEAERDLLGKLLVRIIVQGNEHLGISQHVVSASSAETAMAEGADEGASRRARAARTPPRKWRLRRSRE